jgi:surfeit locus 1 family protein
MGISTRGVLAGVAALLVAAVCVRLGFWQLDRLEQRRAFNSAAAAATTLEPLDLDAGGFEAIETDSIAHLYRRAIARGTFQTGGEVLLRGRSHEGRPGVHLAVPLALEATGRTILVNRGWLPSPDAATVDPRPYRVGGSVTVIGMLQSMPPADAESLPLAVRVGDTTISSFRRLDRDALESALNTRLPPLYLQELPGDPADRPLPIPVPPPDLDEGPHLGYAIQWFAFAAIAVIGFAVIATRRRPL